MTPLPTLIDAIESADLPAQVYRTAVRLARLADEQGRVVLAWDEYQALTGCGHADAARRHLRALRAADLISWRGGATVVVLWSTNAHVVSTFRHYVRVDNNTNGNYVESKRPVVSARQKWFEPRQTLRVGKKTCSVWKRARTVGKQARSVCHLYVWVRTSWLVGITSKPTVKEETQPTNQPLTPARDDTATALDLLVEVGVMPDVAKGLAPLGFDQVRRAVAAWYVQRKDVGGKLDNTPGAVVYWLKNPGKRGFSPILPSGWLDSEIGKKYMTDAERSQYEPSASYAVDLPGVHVMPPSEKPVSVALPPPMPTDDPWAIALSELLPTIGGQAATWLAGSRLQEGAELAGEPFYQVLVTQPGASVEWLTRQAERAIRVKLATLVGKRVSVAFVLVESEPAP